MASLASELERAILDIQSVYERAYGDLRLEARIKDYLPVLVARRTRSIMQRGAR